MPRQARPHLRIEMGELGRVDPFRLSVEESPPGSGNFRVRRPDAPQSLSVERAGLCLVGASQALFQLSFGWLQQVSPEEAVADPAGSGPPVTGEMRLAVRRREARLLGALLRRHIARLPQPPGWMSDLCRALDEMDEFLRWQE